MKQQHGGLKITQKLGLWPNIGKRELNECRKAGMDTANKADRLQEEGLFNVDAVIHFLLIYDELATVFIKPYHESNILYFINQGYLKLVNATYFSFSVWMKYKIPERQMIS